jgi:hypothetical protein
MVARIPRSSRSCRYLGAIFVLLCILVPALTFYGQSSALRHGYAFTTSVVGAITSPFSSSSSKDQQEQDTDDGYMAICLAVRDQGLDLPEFLQHHYNNMGFGRIYILDDGSEPPLETLADTYGVPRSALTFVYYNASEHTDQMQYKMYDECADSYGGSHTWLAFIDADEFFDTPGGERLEDVLRDLEDVDEVGALGVNWQMHTSNGQLQRMPSVRGAYSQCIYDDPDHDGEASDNKHIKSIVRARDYAGPVNPHKFNLAPGKVTVGEDGKEIESYAFRQPITRARVSLHHYAVKSRAEYLEKMARSNAMVSRFWSSFMNSG